MKMVKCRHCKKQIAKQDSHKVECLTKSLNVMYKYYCSEECEKKQIKHREDKARLKEIEKLSRQMTREILELYSDKNIYFSKMYKDLRDTFGDQTIYEYINENKHYIESVLESKNFETIHSKIKYFFAMAQNNIEKYKLLSVKQDTYRSSVTSFDDFEIIEVDQKNKKRSIDDILNNL